MHDTNHRHQRLLCHISCCCCCCCRWRILVGCWTASIEFGGWEHVLASVFIRIVAKSSAVAMLHSLLRTHTKPSKVGLLKKAQNALQGGFQLGTSAPSRGQVAPCLSLWAPMPTTKRHLDRFNHVCTDDRRVSLYFTMVASFPLKIAPSHDGIWTTCNTWFLGPTRVLNPNGNLSGVRRYAFSICGC